MTTLQYFVAWLALTVRWTCFLLPPILLMMGVSGNEFPLSVGVAGLLITAAAFIPSDPLQVDRYRIYPDPEDDEGWIAERLN
jgi:hypothetical protein